MSVDKKLLSNILRCEKCENWNDGEGNRGCIKCKDFKKVLKEMKIDDTKRNYRERIVKTKGLLEKVEGNNKFNDYKEILYNEMHRIKLQQYKKGRNWLMHRAVLGLSLLNFTPTEIGKLLNVSRVSIYNIFKKYI